MSSLHESFHLLEAPLDSRLQEFQDAYSVWAEDGIPTYGGFDFLDWPELVSWMTVVHYPTGAKNRYSLKNARMIFDGVRRVNLFEADMSERTMDSLDTKFQDRWSSLYGLGLRHRQPVFARSHVFGIGKDHIEFEIGLYPFADEDGMISHILSLVQRVYD